MTSAWGGGEGGTQKADDITDKLRECDSVKGGWSQQDPEILRASYLHVP